MQPYFCLCCRGASYDRPISGRATRKDLVLFAAGLKGREGQAAVNGLNDLEPAALLSAPTKTLKEGNTELGKLLVADMVGAKAQVRHQLQGFNQQGHPCHAQIL